MKRSAETANANNPKHTAIAAAPKRYRFDEYKTFVISSLSMRGCFPKLAVDQRVGRAAIVQHDGIVAGRYHGCAS